MLSFPHLPRRARPLAVAVLVALALGACGGGSSSSKVSVTNTFDEPLGEDGVSLAPPGELLRLGGGGSSNGTEADSTSGGDGGQFQVVGGPNGGTVPGVNIPITLFFSDDVDPASVNVETVQVVTIEDPLGFSTAGAGIVPQITFSVTDNRVIVRPTVNFSDDEVTFGFVGDALYEVSFAGPLAGGMVQSTLGQPLDNSNVTFFFRTPTTVFDFNPGWPRVRAFLVPESEGDLPYPDTIVDLNGDGKLTEEVLLLYGSSTEIVPLTPPLQVPIKPVEDIIFVFEDGVLPASVLNTADGTSPALSVAYNAASGLQFNSKAVPADLSFVHQQLDLTVMGWKPQVAAYPPSGLLITGVTATVQDLSGNSKASITGDSTPDLAATMRVAGGVDLADYTFFEPFDDKFKEDLGATTADWGEAVPGQLGPVLGGGNGQDGVFVLDPLGTNENPLGSVIPLGGRIDFTAQRVELPTVKQVAPGVFEPRVYQFEGFELPEDWTLTILTDRNGDGEFDDDEFLVQSPGHPLDGLGAPLQILATGDITIGGTVDVSGPAAPLLNPAQSPNDPAFADYVGRGAETTRAAAAAGDGGRGGDVLLLDENGDIAVALQSPLAVPDYQASDGKITGVTGRSSQLTATTLVDPVNDFSILNTDPVLSAQLAAGEILLQPNVGVGSGQLGNAGTLNENIDENHPTFVVESITVDGGATTITIGGGSLTQASKNIGQAPIAAAGDCYLLGRLNGSAGSDAAPLARQGGGAEAYVVVNEGALGITTTSGGGGGGGSVTPGVSGESDGPASDPLVFQRGGSGGISQSESAGADGGLGAIRGLGRVVSDTEIELLRQIEGRSLSELTGTALAGQTLAPNADQDGWLFEIVSFDGIHFTVARIEKDILDVGLTDPAGPNLTPGSDYAFAILPRLDVGGAGGGGTGVSVTGTVNFAPYVLPRLKPGAGGGAGAGAALLESASLLRLLDTGRILARGGDGGFVADLQGQFAGGGGGGGGNAVLRGGLGVEALLGGLVSVVGGDGGGLSGFGRGGGGGDGFIRIENGFDSVDPDVFSQVTEPDLGEINVGRLVAEPGGIAQSRFFQAVVVNPEYDAVEVLWEADTNGDGVAEPFTWTYSDTGVSGDFETPPFRFLVNSVAANNQGFLDAPNQNDGFSLASDLVGARTGLVYDPETDEVLYATGRDTYQIERLDPTTLVQTGFPLPIDTTVATPFNPLRVVSMALSPEFGGELFMLQRLSGDILVLSRDGLDPKRTISLAFAPQGPMVYFPAPVDRLLLVDNAADRLVVIPSVDPTAASPEFADFGAIEPLASYPIVRDGEHLDVEFTGLAYDEATSTLWAVDGFSGYVMQIDMSAGNEGTSLSGVHAYAPLQDAAGTPARVLPSSVAFDGSSLFLVHAVDPLDCRIQAIEPGAISLTGEPLSLASFGTLLPAGARSSVDGELFLRFRVQLTGQPESEPTPFDKVRVNDITLIYENKPF